MCVDGLELPTREIRGGRDRENKWPVTILCHFHFDFKLNSFRP
jgi:hypothetical protein